VRTATFTRRLPTVVKAGNKIQQAETSIRQSWVTHNWKWKIHETYCDAVLHYTNIIVYIIHCQKFISYT